MNEAQETKHYSSLFRTQSILEHQNKCLASRLTTAKQDLNIAQGRLINFERSLDYLLEIFQKSELLLQILGNRPHLLSAIQPSAAGKPQRSGLSDHLSKKLALDETPYYRSVDAVVKSLYRDDSKAAQAASQAIVNFFESLMIQIIEDKSQRVQVDLKPIPETISLPDDAIVAEQALKLLELETRLSQVQTSKARNANYYTSVIKEHFEKDADHLRQQIQADEKHVCYCNLCGDDINRRCKELVATQVEEKVAEIKSQISVQKVESGDTSELQSRLAEETKAREALDKNYIELQKSFDQLQVKYNALEKLDSDCLKAQALELLTELDKTKRQNETMARQIQHAKRAEKPDISQVESKKLQEQIAANQTKIEEFRENYSKLQTVIADLTKAQQKAAAPDSEMKVDKPVVDFAAIQKKLTEDRQATQQQLTEAEAQTKLFKQRYEHYKNKCLKSEELIGEKQTELEALRKDNAALKSLPSKIEELKNGDVKETVEKYEKLKRAYFTLEKQKSDVQKQLDTEKKAAEQLNYSKGQLEEELKGRDGAISAKNQMIDDVYGQIDQLCESQAQLDTQIASLETENAKLKGSLSEMELLQHQNLAGKANAEARVGELDAELLKVRHDLETLRSLDELVSCQHELEQRLTKKQADLETFYQAQRQQLESQQKHMIAVNSSFKAELKEKDELVQQVQSEKASIANSRIKLEQKLADSKAQFASMKKEGAATTNTAKKSGTWDFSDEGRIKFLQHERNKLLKQVQCSNCQDREKDIALKCCGHMFCSLCIDQQIQSRKRNCPTCRIKFTPGDVMRIFMNVNDDEESERPATKKRKLSD